MYLLGSLHDILKQVRQVEPDMNVLSFWERQFLTIGVITVLALVNIRGVRWGGGLQLFITMIKVVSLLATSDFAIRFVGT